MQQPQESREMISADTVTRTWERIGTMPPEQVPRLIEQMRREQPIILAYLMAMTGQPEFSSEDRETVFYIGVVVWQIMKQSPRGLRRVSERKLDEVLDANDEQLEKLAAGGTNLQRAVEAMVKSHAEPEALRYIVEALMEEEEPGEPPVSAASLGLAFLTLKNTLDALVLSRA